MDFWLGGRETENSPLILISCYIRIRRVSTQRWGLNLKQSSLI